MTYLLDANTLACALNDTGGVRARVNDAEATARILTSAVVVAELSFGASASAHKFGALKASLRKRGLARATPTCKSPRPPSLRMLFS